MTYEKQLQSYRILDFNDIHFLAGANIADKRCQLAVIPLSLKIQRPAMNPNDKPLKTFYHQGREQSLLAVKHSLKQHRQAYMVRKMNEIAVDVIDVVENGKIIERHIAKGAQQNNAIVVIRHVPVEEMALYR